MVSTIVPEASQNESKHARPLPAGLGSAVDHPLRRSGEGPRPLSRSRRRSGAFVEPDLAEVVLEGRVHAVVLHRRRRMVVELAPVGLHDDARNPAGSARSPSSGPCASRHRRSTALRRSWRRGPGWNRRPRSRPRRCGRRSPRPGCRAAACSSWSWSTDTWSSRSRRSSPGSTVRFTLMPASRSWAAMASPVFLCQSSSTVISSCSKSAWPASAISAFALAGSRATFGSSTYSGWIGQTWWFSASVAGIAVAELEHDGVVDGELQRLADLLVVIGLVVDVGARHDGRGGHHFRLVQRRARRGSSHSRPRSRGWCATSPASKAETIADGSVP